MPSYEAPFFHDPQLAAVALDDFSCLVFEAVAHSIGANQ